MCVCVQTLSAENQAHNSLMQQLSEMCTCGMLFNCSRFTNSSAFVLNGASVHGGGQGGRVGCDDKGNAGPDTTLTCDDDDVRHHISVQPHTPLSSLSASISFSLSRGGSMVEGEDVGLGDTPLSKATARSYSASIISHIHSSSHSVCTKTHAGDNQERFSENSFSSSYYNDTSFDTSHRTSFDPSLLSTCGRELDFEYIDTSSCTDLTCIIALPSSHSKSLAQAVHEGDAANSNDNTSILNVHPFVYSKAGGEAGSGGEAAVSISLAKMEVAGTAAGVEVLGAVELEGSLKSAAALQVCLHALESRFVSVWKEQERVGEIQTAWERKRMQWESDRYSERARECAEAEERLHIEKVQRGKEEEVNRFVMSLTAELEQSREAERCLKERMVLLQQELTFLLDQRERECVCERERVEDTTCVRCQQRERALNLGDLQTHGEESMGYVKMRDVGKDIHAQDAGLQTENTPRGCGGITDTDTKGRWGQVAAEAAAAAGNGSLWRSVSPHIFNAQSDCDVWGRDSGGGNSGGGGRRQGSALLVEKQKYFAGLIQCSIIYNVLSSVLLVCYLELS